MNIWKEKIINVKDGDNQYPLEHIIDHSMTGMAYGFVGSGPTDAAISVLFDLLGHLVDSKIHQAFMYKFIATIPLEEGGSISEGSIREWLKINAPELLSDDSNG